MATRKYTFKLKSGDVVEVRVGPSKKHPSRERGWQEYLSEAFVEGKKVGYMKVDHLVPERTRRLNSTPWHYLELYQRVVLGRGGWIQRPDKLTSLQKKELKKWEKETQKEFESHLQDVGDKPLVAFVKVETPWRRKGVAIAMYRAMGRWLARKGLTLRSGMLNQKSRAVWEKMMGRLPVRRVVDLDKDRFVIDYRRVASKVASRWMNLTKYASTYGVLPWEDDSQRDGFYRVIESEDRKPASNKLLEEQKALLRSLKATSRMTVYRGSNSRSGALRVHPGRGVLYFTKYPWQADNYGRYVHKFVLNLRKPFNTTDGGLVDQFNVNGRDLKEFQDRGYDSVVYDIKWNSREPSQIIIFDPSQARIVDTTPLSEKEIDDSWSRYMGRMASRVAARYKSKKKVETADGKEMTVYEYSKGQVSYRNRQKAKKVEKLRKDIGKIRGKVREDVKSDDPKVRLPALVVALIDETYERVGNPESSKKGHFGVTGWKVEHVTFQDGKATIEYVGKSGVQQKKTVERDWVLEALKRCMVGKKKGDGIFEGECQITSHDVVNYLKPFGVTAKDIRGFHANLRMQKTLRHIRSKGPKLPYGRKEKDKILKSEFKEALEETAEMVGHEPSTLRSQYLIPGLEDTYLQNGTVQKTLKYSRTYKNPCSLSWEGRFGWIDPNGKLVPINTNHLAWAEKYLEKKGLLDEVDKGFGTALNYLLRHGWVRVVDFRYFETTRGVRLNPAIFRTMFKMVVNCLKGLNDKEFKHFFDRYTGERIRLSPLWEKKPIEFLNAFGSSHEINQVFAPRIKSSSYEDVRQRILDWVEGFGDPLTLYRSVVVPSVENIRLSNLGVYWTPEKDKAHSPFGVLDAVEGQEIIIQAKVPRSLVDEKGTIRAMQRHPGEREIRLVEDVPVQVEGYWMGRKFLRQRGRGKTAATYDRTDPETVEWVKGFYERHKPLRKYSRIPVVRVEDPSRKRHPEASFTSKGIELYPKFRRLSPRVKDFVFAHEIGHAVLERWGYRNFLTAAEIVGVDPWDTPNLPFGQYNFDEAFSDSFASYHTDKDVQRRYPEWTKLIEAAIKKVRIAGRIPLGPSEDLMHRPDARVRYRVRVSGDGIGLAVYYGRKKIGGMNATPVGMGWVEDCRPDVEVLVEKHPQVQGRRFPKMLRVFKAFITDESRRGLGIGKAMYLALASEWFKKTGPFLFMPMQCSGSGTSFMARRVWASLARDYPSSGDVIAILRRPRLPADVRMATKTPSEKEDAEIERLIRKSPKHKPPRRDRRRNRINPSEDPDLSMKEEKKDVSRNYKVIGSSSQVASRWLMAAKPKERRPGEVWKTESGKWRSKNPKGVPKTFDEKSRAETWAGRSEEPRKRPEIERKPKRKDVFKDLSESLGMDPEKDSDVLREIEREIKLVKSPEEKAEIRRSIKDSLANLEEEGMSFEDAEREASERMFPDASTDERARQIAAKVYARKVQRKIQEVLDSMGKPEDDEDDFSGPVGRWEDLEEALKEMNPEGLDVVTESFDKAYKGLKRNPPPTKDAVEDAKAVKKEKFPKDPKGIGEFMARAEFARNVTENPLSDLSISEDDDPSSVAKVDTTGKMIASYRLFKDLDAFGLEDLGRKVSKMLRGATPGSPKYRELESTLDGIATAAARRGVKVRGRPEPPAFLTRVLSILGDSEGDMARLIKVMKDPSSPESQASIKKTLEMKPGLDIIEIAGGMDGPMGPLAKALLSDRVGEKQKELIRKLLVSGITDGISILDPLVRDYANANKEPTSPEKRKEEIEKGMASTTGKLDVEEIISETEDLSPEESDAWLARLRAEMVTGVLDAMDREHTERPPAGESVALALAKEVKAKGKLEGNIPSTDPPLQRMSALIRRYDFKLWTV